MRDVKELLKLQDEQQQRIAKLLHGATKTPWWTQFVVLIRERRAAFLEELSFGIHDQRTEDRLRGQIQEDAWIIALQEHAENLTIPNEENDNAT